MAAYAVFNFSLRLLSSEILQLKRIRIIPAVVDVIFISLVVSNSSGPGNSWFLFYLFPIISVSRYLGYGGTLFLAVCSIIGYLSVYVTSVPHREIDPQSFVLRCMVLIGVGAVAANLARARQKEFTGLIKVIEEIDDAILSNLKLEQILNLILKRGLEATNSEMGHIRLRDDETREYEIVTAIGHPKGYDWGTRPLDDSYSRVAVRLKEPLIVPQIKKRHLSQYLGTYFRLHQPRPKSALFVPLTLKDDVIGIIAVYSHMSRHYTKMDGKRLAAFTSLIQLAMKTAAARERHRRLRSLNEIGKNLRSGLSLPALFKQIVELTVLQIDAQDVALFVRSEDEEGQLERVKVGGAEESGPVRTLDCNVDSFTETVFRTGRPLLKNDITPKDRALHDYSNGLPSGGIKHYLGVPLIVDEEVLGVVRVINKKSASYSQGNKAFVISEKGFDKEEDVELLQIIASLVAPELRSARRFKKLAKAQRYYRDLIVNSPDPIIVLDQDGRIKVFNKACEELWGVKFDEAKGKSVTEYYVSEEHARYIGRRLWESQNHQVENINALVKHRTSGEIIPISLSACFVKDEQGERDGSIGVFKDRRTAIALEEKMLQAERLAVVGRLAGTAGHDIKHSLATAKNYIIVLLRKCDKEKQPKLYKIYTNVNEALREAIDQFQNLLTTNTPKPPKKIVLEIGDVLRRVEKQMGEQARDRGIKFLVKYPEEKHELSGDIEQLALVLSNLFTNSVHAIEKRKGIAKEAGTREKVETGLIKVSAWIDGYQVQLLWEDNGCGISEHEREKIFNAYFTSKTDDNGTGLGLHIVKTIIENHGGQIMVKTTERPGARFLISLPLCQSITATAMTAAFSEEVGTS